MCPEQLLSMPAQFLEQFGSRKGEVCVILFDWATRLADMLLTPQGLECLKEWGGAYQFLLATRKPPGFTADNNLDEDIEWRENWISLIGLCMA